MVVTGGTRAMTNTVEWAAPAVTDGEPAAAHRVVLKLSGEVFGGGAVGVDPDVVQAIARQIATVVRKGVQVAAVVGGGKFFPGAGVQRRGLDRARARHNGEARTLINRPGPQDLLGE